MRPLEAFGINSGLVKNSSSLRFDASFYNPRVIEALDTLRSSDMAIEPLGAVTERVFIPPRFKRIYVRSEHGVPFLQGSHVVQFQPDYKYLSKTATRNLQKWIIESGWILVTCSGTIGRVAIAPDHWHGWAASQHILRIIPKRGKTCPVGYLASYLSSPIGQVQLTASIYGAVVDELTEEQARSVQVAIAKTPGQQRQIDKINAEMLRAVEGLSQTYKATEKARSGLTNLLPTYPATTQHPAALSEAQEAT